MALRAMPREGGSVVVNYLGARIRGTVRAVREEGRELEVQTTEGEVLAFALNRATARFTLGGGLTGARLSFVPEGGQGQD
jgi:hypothetical protein